MVNLNLLTSVVGQTQIQPCLNMPVSEHACILVNWPGC